MRYAELLSMTRQPAFTASGASAFVIAPPVAKNARSTSPNTPGLRFLDRVLLARIADDLAHRTGRGEKPKRRDREIALMQKLQQFLTDGAGGTDDGDCERGRLVPWRSPWEGNLCSRLGIKPADRILVVRIGTPTLQFYAANLCW